MVKAEIKPLSKFQLIWAQAKQNGTVVDFDSMPARKWDWPTDTFMRRRLALLKALDCDNFLDNKDESGTMKLTNPT